MRVTEEAREAEHDPGANGTTWRRRGRLLISAEAGNGSSAKTQKAAERVT